MFQRCWSAQPCLCVTKHSWQPGVEVRCGCGRLLSLSVSKTLKQQLQPGARGLIFVSGVQSGQLPGTSKPSVWQAEGKASVYHRQQTEVDNCASSAADVQALPSDADSITEYSDFGKLGMLAAVVDDAAIDFVLGPCGSKNRPDGMLDIEYLHNADRAGWLSNEEKIRWSKFVQIWAQAGFELQRLLLITCQLRCLQYGSDLDLADLPSVRREQLDDCLAEYCETKEEADMLRDFVDFVHVNFSQAQAVLLPADNVQQHLSSIQVS